MSIPIPDLNLNIASPSQANSGASVGNFAPVYNKPFDWKTLLVIGGVAVVVLLLWKKR